MGADLVVRAVRPDEYERVGELTIGAYRTLPVDHMWGGYDAEIRAVEQRLEKAEVFVAVERGEIVGAVTYASDPDSPWLEWSNPGEAQIRLLAVDPNARGRRVAEALVVACIERAREQGLTILLHTTRHMTAAQRLYERMGFERRPDRDVHEFVESHDMAFLAYTYDPSSPAR